MDDRKLNWMGLKVFDDTTFDDYSSKEWLEKARKSVCPFAKKKVEHIHRDQIIRKKTLILMKSKSKNFGLTRSKIFDQEEENKDQKNIKS